MQSLARLSFPTAGRFRARCEQEDLASILTPIVCDRLATRFAAEDITHSRRPSPRSPCNVFLEFLFGHRLLYAGPCA